VPEADDAEEQRRDREEAWAAYYAALANGVNEFEARIQGDWVKFNRAVERRARKARKGMADALSDLPDTVDPAADDVLAVRAESDEHLWEFLTGVVAVLGISEDRRRVDDPEQTIEVFNRRYKIDTGGPAAVIGAAKSEALDIADEATKIAKRTLRADPASTARAAKLAALDQGLEGAWDADDSAAAASYVDNIIRALEQKVHQQSIAVVDATAGAHEAEAVTEAAELFDPVTPTLEASFLTHQRAAFRSTLADMGRTFERAWPEEDIGWMYYEPVTARADLAPSGFGASHFGLIRTAEEWEAIRQGMDRSRPGSFIFTTGFHINSTGYLIPIPATLAGVAREKARRERQKFLEKKREEE
jgi:hypothetical protein